MQHTKALMLALVAATATACASGGAAPEEAGNAPRETEATRQAGVHLVQAGLTEGEGARVEYEAALEDALTAVAQTPMNPKGHLIAGQAAVGLDDYVRADTMFDQALELYPGYEDQITAEREEAWVTAYNAGAEALNAGDLDEAIEWFHAADAMYQGRPEARIALGSVYAQQGDVEAAAEAYVAALDILMADPPEGLNEEQLAAWSQSRPTAALNAAELLAQSGDFERAAEVLEGYLSTYGDELDASTARRARTGLAGFYAQAGNQERAEEIYEEILGREDLTANEYFQAGIGFFNTGDYDRAADAFGTAAELNPYARDAILNLVQSLYSQALEVEETEQTPERDEQLRELYQGVIDRAADVQALDPLNRNLVTFVLRAYRQLADLSEAGEAERLNQRAQALFRDYQAQEFEVSNIQLALQSEDQTRVSGTLTTLQGQPGETVSLRFEVVDESGQTIDSTVIDVEAPAQGSATQFVGSLNVPGGEFAGWRYEVVE